MKKLLSLLLVMSIAIAVYAAPNAGGVSAQELNQQTVIDFYNKAINDKDFDAAKVHFGNRYIQHNPMAADGPEGLKAYIGYLKANKPKLKAEIKRSFADGDYVILHVHVKDNPTDRGVAVVDIYKMENGKVVEHWDVIQPVPEKALNDNTMF
jgi:predicted SnoaL-like aldol condensation-catalyzing enzyme